MQSRIYCNSPLFKPSERFERNERIQRKEGRNKANAKHGAQRHYIVKTQKIKQVEAAEGINTPAYAQNSKVYKADCGR